jgi:5-hydroxyisourate hydrolase
VTVSTHILDAVAGRPATGVSVALLAADSTFSADSTVSWLAVEAGVTDADGRFRFAAETSAGGYRLVFATGPYFAVRAVPAFYPEVAITFTIASEAHCHVPLLLSPFAYSTYRGS